MCKAFAPYGVLILNSCVIKSTAYLVAANNHPQDTYFALSLGWQVHMYVTPGGTFRYMSIRFGKFSSIHSFAGFILSVSHGCRNVLWRTLSHSTVV